MQNGFLGIDGCRGGWFIVHLTATGNWTTALVGDSVSLADHINQSRLSLIDIPIGLLDSGGPQRQCDQLARKVLGMPRAASVFSPPCHKAVYATGYDQACRLNFQWLGKKLSKQTWNITPKIRQIDEMLKNQRVLRKILRECHPEVALWALNDGNAMQFNKKEAAGRAERLRVLSRYLPTAHAIMDSCMQSYRRKDVALDDIIDALTLVVTAVQGKKTLRSIPPRPSVDLRGLTMEIVFFDPQNVA